MSWGKKVLHYLWYVFGSKAIYTIVGIFGSSGGTCTSRGNRAREPGNYTLLFAAVGNHKMASLVKKLVVMWIEKSIQHELGAQKCVTHCQILP